MEKTLSEAKMTGGVHITLRSMLRLRVLFGYYCDLSDSCTLRFIAYIYCICIAYCASALILQDVNTSSSPTILLLFVFTIIEYNLNVLFSFLTGESHFLEFCKVIEQVDKELEFAHLPLITPAVQNIFLFIFGFRILFCVGLFFVRFNLNIIWTFVSIAFISTAVSFNCLINIIPLDLLRHRLVLLRYTMKLKLKQHKWNNVNMDFQVNHTNNCMNIYRTLIYKHNATFSWEKIQIVVRLASAFALFLGYGYDTISMLKNDMIGAIDSIMAATLCMFVCTLACLPAVFAELVTREVDKFKIVIGNSLLECNEGLLGTTLERAAEYLELRPFRVTVWRVCTLDASLIISFAGLCATYLVILIQITGVI